MFGNVPKRFIPDPEYLPELIFAHPDIQYVHYRKTLNACDMILHEGIREERGRRDRMAVIDLNENKRFTFGQLERMVNRMACALKKLGVNPGDRVLWSLEERVEAIVSQLAIWKIGAVSVPSSVTERARELGWMIADTEAVLVITQPGQYGELEKAAEQIKSVKWVILTDRDAAANKSGTSTLNLPVFYWDDLMAENEEMEICHPNAPLDVSSIFYTGGTTGRPKGCIQTHAGEVVISDLNLKHVRAITWQDVMFTHAPIGHAFGNCEKINHPLRAGCTVVLKNRPRPEQVWNILAECGVTIMAGAPTMYQMMLNQLPSGFDPKKLKLRICFCSGEYLTNSLYDRWKNLTGVPLSNAVGTSPMREAFIDSVSRGSKIAPGTSVGRPIPGYEVKLLREDGSEAKWGEMGRLAVRGPTGIAYWKNIHPNIEQKNREDIRDGWSLIDDAFEFDREGWLWFKTRLDNMIVSGGRQIAATEVEEVVGNHPAVERIAVVGVPDEERGQIVKAFIQLKPGIVASEELKHDIREYAKANMAVYKCPRLIEFVPEISLDKVGKIQRRNLRESSQREARG